MRVVFLTFDKKLDQEKEQNKTHKAHKHPYGTFVVFFVQIPVFAIAIDHKDNKRNYKYNGDNPLTGSKHNDVVL